MHVTEMDFVSGQWLNRPEHIEQRATELVIETAAQTDFWQETHYGFSRSSGHALLFDMPQTYAAEITFRGAFHSKYEQAGFLLWHDERHWIKAGVEYADGTPNLAVVVTRERSDWSMVPVPAQDGPVTLRLSVTESAVIVHALRDGRWHILRVTDFAHAAEARLGPMVCSPESSGLRVSFDSFRHMPLPDDPLYLARPE